MSVFSKSLNYFFYLKSDIIINFILCKKSQSYSNHSSQIRLILKRIHIPALFLLLSANALGLFSQLSSFL